MTACLYVPSDITHEEGYSVQFALKDFVMHSYWDFFEPHYRRGSPYGVNFILYRPTNRVSCWGFILGFSTKSTIGIDDFTILLMLWSTCYTSVPGIGSHPNYLLMLEF